MKRATTQTTRTHDISGELLPPDDGALVPWQGSERQPLRVSLPRADAGAPMLEHEIRRPARAPGLASDFAVPALQAFATGIAGAVVAGVGVMLWDWQLRVILIAFGLTFASAWVWRLRLADALLWEVERLTGFDINHDGNLGQPGRAVLVNPATARAEVMRETADTTAEAERQELARFLHRCFTTGTSEAAHGITRGSGSQRADYIRRRDVLLSLGIAQWRNENRPSAGWRIAVSHQRAVELLARHIL